MKKNFNNEELYFKPSELFEDELGKYFIKSEYSVFKNAIDKEWEANYKHLIAKVIVVPLNDQESVDKNINMNANKTLNKPGKSGVIFVVNGGKFYPPACFLECLKSIKPEEKKYNKEYKVVKENKEFEKGRKFNKGGKGFKKDFNKPKYLKDFKSPSIDLSKVEKLLEEILTEIKK